MNAHHRFLVIDDNADSRFLVTKTLLQKFPGAIVQECQESEAAIAALKSDKPNVVVAHRAADLDGLSLIRALRAANGSVPILMVSGIDRSVAAAEAGATEFLNYDQWQRVGAVVATLVAKAG